MLKPLTARRIWNRGSAKEKADWKFDGKPFRESEGYQAPPLDGIWATAPYLHNGSVPTLEGVLNSKGATEDPYSQFQNRRSGLRQGESRLEGGGAGRSRPDAKTPAFERRKVYDTSKPGRGNGGHIYGDKLSDEERGQVIEYLKTL